MRKYVAAAAVAASAAATFVLTPFAAHAAIPTDSEIRTGCVNGVTGFVSLNPSQVNPTSGTNFAASFGLNPGTSWDISSAFGLPLSSANVATGSDANLPAGIWTFTIHQPSALEATGPSLDEDKSFEFGNQRVEKAVVVLDDGRTMQFFNDKANSFSFFVPPSHTVTTAAGAPLPFNGITYGVGVPFHVYYQCGIGKA